MTIAASYDALARMLDYPLEKERLQTDYDLVSTFLKERGVDNSLSSFAGFTSASSLAALQEEYVATFDFNPATAPYLGHHLFGDNQKKGGYMIMLKQEFIRYGFSPSCNELPDHVSVLLAFLAHLARQEGNGVRRPLIDKSILPGIERLNAAVADRDGTPWKAVIEAARMLCEQDCKEVQPC